LQRKTVSTFVQEFFAGSNSVETHLSCPNLFSTTSFIVAGEINRAEKNHQLEQNISIAEAVVHREFNEQQSQGSSLHDIALLRLSSPLQFNGRLASSYFKQTE